MLIIPALDLKENLVVRATGGNRALYQPVKTAHFPRSELADIVKRMRENGKFKVFYIADLDAIEGREANKRPIQEITELYPDCEFWLDAGIRTSQDLHELNQFSRCIPIVATETLTDETLPARLLDRGCRWILSLDTLQNKQLGPTVTHADCSCWPKEVIFLSLGNVGNQCGLELARIQSVPKHARNKKLIIGGGARNLADILSAKKAGAYGVLASNTIYEGTILQATPSSNNPEAPKTSREKSGSSFKLLPGQKPKSL